MIERLLHGVGFAKPSGRRFFAFNDTQAVIAFGECFQYRSRCIRRAVIDGNDLKPPIVLGQNGANTVCQDTMLFVASRNKNRYKRRIARRHTQMIGWQQGLLARKTIQRENNTHEPGKNNKPNKACQYRCYSKH